MTNVAMITATFLHAMATIESVLANKTGLILKMEEL